MIQSIGQRRGLQLAKVRTVCQSREPKELTGPNPLTPMLVSATSSESCGGIFPKVRCFHQKSRGCAAEAHQCPRGTLFFSRILLKLTLSVEFLDFFLPPFPHSTRLLYGILGSYQNVLWLPFLKELIMYWRQIRRIYKML